MKIKLTENKLKQIVSESIKNVLSEARRPKDAYFGGYFFEGIGFDINGNPIYCSEHLPIEAKKQLGWRKSAKYGMRGQADEWVVPHVLKELGLPFGNDNEEEYYDSLNESALKQIVAESVKKVLSENLYGMNRLQGKELYDRIDEYLSDIGDAEVCRFYCTDSIINIAMNRTLGQEGKKQIFNIMGNLGYKCVNAGSNGEYIMYDFKLGL